MTRTLLYVACTLAALAPAGVGAGLWLAVNAGVGVAAGSVGYGLTGWALLTLDMFPTPPQSEAVR